MSIHRPDIIVEGTSTALEIIFALAFFVAFVTGLIRSVAK